MTQKISELDLFRLKNKLGIDQEVTNEDVETFKMLDPRFDDSKIEICPSPEEKLKWSKYFQLRQWVSFGLLSFILQDIVEL